MGDEMGDEDSADKTVRNWSAAGVLLFILAAAILIIWRSHAPATTDKAFTPGTVPYDIANEQLVYSWLWTNWTATDWVLTILAAGTAIGAAVKNAFSAHNQAQEQSAKFVAAADAAAKGERPAATVVPPPASNGVDKWVMVLAALTIIATTLDAKMHPGVQADRYRRGDLILQEALMDYKVSKDEGPLVASWHKAQRVLEGLDATAEQKPEKPERSAGVTKDAAGPEPVSTDQKRRTKNDIPNR